jgi:hypothetical protein
MDLQEFGERFSSLFEREAYRLELLDYYDSPHFLRWQAGQPYDRRHWDDLLAQPGKNISRVHVIAEPLTEYLRHELDYYSGSVAAGEDVRILPSDRAEGLELPDFDYWLFDSRLAAEMVYDDAGNWLEARLDSNPAFVAECRRWRDIAKDHAMPLAEYLAGKEAA